jgi:hypothetical protein
VVDGEVPTALEIVGEVVPVVLDGDGVHDGLQEITASPKVWSTISRTSCNGGKGRLELGVLAGELWARRRSAWRRRSGMRHSYQRLRTSRRVRW